MSSMTPKLRLTIFTMWTSRGDTCLVDKHAVTKSADPRTYGTLPLQYYAADVAKAGPYHRWSRSSISICQLFNAFQVVQRCTDVMTWESKRRQAGHLNAVWYSSKPHVLEVLKESFQPAVAYLMCDAGRSMN